MSFLCRKVQTWTCDLCGYAVVAVASPSLGATPQDGWGRLELSHAGNEHGPWPPTLMQRALDLCPACATEVNLAFARRLAPHRADGEPRVTGPDAGGQDR